MLKLTITFDDWLKWITPLPFRSLSTMKVNPVVRGCSTYSNFGRLFWTANASLLALVFSAGDTDT